MRMLVRRDETLMGRAAKLRQEIETLGGTIGRSVSRLSPGTSSMRPRNKSNLVDALKSVLMR
ncbi:MAG: hypothetical protein EPO19_06735 [Betaproteobacteria bacterium]|nr:MAG: hypothetical protein EPO19_06735 [Betaproteobacteria bacterium]